MPDRATILAATPKCPVKVPSGHRCGQTLAWSERFDVWVCECHGHVTTGEKLVARQLLASA